MCVIRSGVGGQDERFDQAIASSEQTQPATGWMCCMCVLLSRKPPVWIQMKGKPESRQSRVFIQLIRHKRPDFSALCLCSVYLKFAYCNLLLFFFLFFFAKDSAWIVGIDRARRGWQTFMRFLRLWLFWPCGVAVSTSEVETASVTRVFCKQNTCLS